MPMPSHHHAHPYDTLANDTTSDFGMAGLGVGVHLDEQTSDSPETNPYRSPPAERGDAAEQDLEKSRAMAAAGFDQASNFSSLPRGFAPGSVYDTVDRTQTSSAAGNKGFPALNTIGGWASAMNTGTPDRERPAFTSAFGSSLFSPVTDLQSPGFGEVPRGFAQASMSGARPAASMRSTSKLGPLFPPAMQAQMQQNQDQEGLADSMPDLRQSNPLGAIGRASARPQAPDIAARGIFDDTLADTSRTVAAMFTTTAEQAPGLASASTVSLQQFDSLQHQSRNETPPNQERTMVMPDRMRWVYLDPQSEIQGPFTGLEMNDWYKANFFTPDLRVKRVEDPEFEPLGQLIRRIGNSREPFLVPQMGIPHGPPSLTGTFTHGDRGAVIPPLVGAFPSFGRTLTAEEQNNLERRKQEEQFMMAQQREMLVAAARSHHSFRGVSMASGSAPNALHHHSSAHSLQSQPSFGSMTSPLGTGQPPIGAMGATQPFFDQQSTAPPQSAQTSAMPSSEFLRDDPSLRDRRVLAGMQASGAVGGGFLPSQASMSTAAGAGESSFRTNLVSADQLQSDPLGFSDRLKEFKELRAQREAKRLLLGLAWGLSPSSHWSRWACLARLPRPRLPRSSMRLPVRCGMRSIGPLPLLKLPTAFPSPSRSRRPRQLRGLATNLAWTFRCPSRHHNSSQRRRFMPQLLSGRVLHSPSNTPTAAPSQRRLRAWRLARLRSRRRLRHGPASPARATGAQV